MAGERYDFLRRQQETVQIRRITDWNRAEFSAFLQNPDAYDRAGGEAAAFGAYISDVPAGAAELVMEEGYIELWSIFVDEERRRGGIGSALLAKVKEFAAEMDVDQIQAEIVNDSHDEAVRIFFEREGFYRSETGETVLVLDPADLLSLELFRKMAARELPKNTVPMNRIPYEVREKLAHKKSSFARDHSLPWNAEGRILPELSLGCPDPANGLGAFVQVVQRADVICLTSAYTDEAHITPFMCLLAHAMAGLADRGVRELYVTVKDPAFLRLMKTLTAENPKLLRSQTQERLLWYLEDEQMDKEADDRALAAAAGRNVQDGMEILVPRLMRLMGILEAENIPCDLMLGALPYLMLDGGIIVHYYPQDEEYERFALVFSRRIQPGAPGGEADRCVLINTACQFAAAVPEEGYILLRYAVPEYGAPAERELFLSCLDTFRGELLIAGMPL